MAMNIIIITMNSIIIGEAVYMCAVLCCHGNNIAGISIKQRTIVKQKEGDDNE